MLKKVYCISESNYSHLITRRQAYKVEAEDVNNYRIKCDDNILKKIPKGCFTTNQDDIIYIIDYSIEILEMISNNFDAEVDIIFSNNEKRWCIFTTPDALKQSGSFVGNTSIKIHSSNQHVIILSEISVDIIKNALLYLDSQDELYECTQLTETY